jgi:hypothetical protein
MPLSICVAVAKMSELVGGGKGRLEVGVMLPCKTDLKSHLLVCHVSRYLPACMTKSKKDIWGSGKEGQLGFRQPSLCMRGVFQTVARINCNI